MKAVVSLSFLVLCSCSTLPKVVRTGHGTSRETNPPHAFVVSHGWHTGIIVDAGRLNALLPELAGRFPSAQYYEIGWGDAGFYQSRRISVALALRAVSWPDDTVVHVVAFRGNPGEYLKGSEVLPIAISGAGYQSLLAYLASSIRQSPGGHIRALGKGLYGDSEFYEGVGKYYLLNTCNTWTAKALASSGFFSGRSAFKLTSSGVMNQVRKCNGRPADKLEPGAAFIPGFSH